MARPTKDGLDYFPLDVHIFEDEKIEAIGGEFGIKGELTVIKLLCAVYEKGYFVVWNDLTKAKLLKRLPGTSKDLLEQVVNRLVMWGFFDEALFNSAKVLTSKTIQANFFEATKRRKTAKPTEYLVNADINAQAKMVNADINTQSKVKESKVKESKEEVAEPARDDPVKSKSFETWEGLWLFPNLVQRQELLELVQKFGDDLVDAAIKIAGTKSVEKGRALNFITAVLNKWLDANVRTLEEARAFERERARSNSKTGYKTPQPQSNLPDWLDKDIPETEMDEAENNEIKARIERLKETRE